MFIRFPLTVCLLGVITLGSGCDRNRLRKPQPPVIQEFPTTAAAPFPATTPREIPVPTPPPPPAQYARNPIPTPTPPPPPGAAPHLERHPPVAQTKSVTQTPIQQAVAIQPAADPVPHPRNDAPSESPTPKSTQSGPTDLPQLLAAAQARLATIPDLEARLIKREVVNGKPMPTEAAIYRYRQKPLSVYLKVTSEAGFGRELLYVQGQDDKLHLVTGKGDHFLRGFKTRLALNDPRLTAKSRYLVTEAGFARTLAGLSAAVSQQAARIIGPHQRPEYPYPLTLVQVNIPAGGEPQLPRGGTRSIYFDTQPNSLTNLLPVLVITHEPNGKEVEYYLFDHIRLPAHFTNADFDPARLGR
ncbi:MAG: DUF1571 domain-containing protein [Bacteroidales bacterium]|nr:DUF1571 domain-containing protein [Bacteroidales bacterium]